MSESAAAVLAQYGAIGIIATLALAAVKVMFGRMTAMLDAERARADRLEAELRRVNDLVREQYIGTIGAAARAINDANQAVANALSAIRRDGG